MENSDETAGFEALQAWLFFADVERARAAAAQFAASHRVAAPVTRRRPTVALLDHYVEPFLLPEVPPCPAINGWCDDAVAPGREVIARVG